MSWKQALVLFCFYKINLHAHILTYFNSCMTVPEMGAKDEKVIFQSQL